MDVEPAGLVIAFSGGPDSLALLLAATRAARPAGRAVVAAHLDHALDPGSSQRAELARGLAARLEIPFFCRRLADRRPPTESREAFARRARYAFLEQAARESGARLVATAHHADDQAETVLLRLLFGSGLDGLGGIAASRPLGAATLLRPLLGLRRAALAAYASAAGLAAVDDPTNRDPRVPRNRVRHFLLPHLAAAEPAAEPEAGESGSNLIGRLCRLAAAGKGAAAAVAARLERATAATATADGARLSRPAFDALPEALQGPALALLHRLAGEAQPAPLEARRELLGQLKRGGKVRCDCGRRGGRNFYWQADRCYLELRRAGHPEPKPVQFTYTFEASGAEPLER